MATVAAREPIMDFPFANIFSMSDGTLDSSTGVPYMYLMPLELSAIDLSHNEKASLTMTMAQVRRLLSVLVYQCSPLSLVEECRDSALIGRELP